jgi:hypothetical protein
MVYVTPLQRRGRRVVAYGAPLTSAAGARWKICLPSSLWPAAFLEWRGSPACTRVRR